MGNAELQRQLSIHKTTLEHQSGFSHPAILQNQRLLAQQFLDICTNHQEIKSLHNGLHTIVEQLNLDFSKAWDEIFLIQQHIIKQDGVIKGFHKELVDKLGSFVDDFLRCKGISADWHNLVNNHCLATEKILESLGANCLKLFDHYNVVATRCNQQEDQFN